MSRDGPSTDEETTPADGGFESTRRWLYVGLAGVAVACGAVRMFGVTTVDRDALLFLAAAAVFLVLERIKRLNVGKEGIQAEFVEQVRQVKQQLNQVQDRVSEVQQVSKEN